MHQKSIKFNRPQRAGCNRFHSNQLEAIEFYKFQ